MSGVIKVIKPLAVIAATIVAGPAAGALVAAGFTVLQAATAKKQKVEVSPANSDRLSVSIDPRTPRKIIFGRTAMATDLRDQENTGGDQEYLHRFIVCASHAVQSIDEIWFDEEKAWSQTGGVTSKFSGYLALDVCTEGSAAEAVNISARMGSSRRYTGLAYVYLRFKLTGNSKKAESPFSQAVPTRITIRGKGAKVYDPRFDSTVPGGSGPQRANDQTTWAWNDSASRNPALQLLWYLLGWKINGKLAVGKGMPPARIDLASFVTAANLCDEPVTLAAGGTEPRYRSDGIFSEADSLPTVLENFKAAMNAELDDVDGKIRPTVLHNDLAYPVADFTEDDILGGIRWDQTPPLDQMFNIIRGGFTDPSDKSLYQMVDYPELVIASPDGIDRIETVNYALVQSVSQAQRLAKQRVARMLYAGTFQATFGHRAWKVQKNDIIRLTFKPLGWTNKLFRVAETSVQVDGQVPMVLREEHEDIYLWDAEESPAVQPVENTVYDPFLNPLYQALGVIDADISAALALAASKGKVTFGATLPTLAASSVNDTHMMPDGTMWQRIETTYWLVGGDRILVGGDPLVTGWILASVQPIRDAYSTANLAYDQANAAIDRLDGLADDGILSVSEKTEILIPSAASLEARYAELAAQASAFGITTPLTAAAAARSAWLAYLAGLSPAWNNSAFDTPVSRAAYDAARGDYDSALYALHRAIVDHPATLAQSAQDDATAALTAAADAQADADAAAAELVIIAADDYIDRGEKPGQWAEYQRILAEQTDLTAKATALGITTELTAYTGAITALTTYVGALSPALNNYSLPTAVVRATYVGKFNDANYGAAALLTKMAEIAATKAQIGNVSGTLSGYSITDIVGVAIDFDDRNDRDGSPVTGPTFAGDGTAVDHVINVNGSADLSLEWSWSGTNSTIDGFEVMLVGRTSSSAYTPGASPASETIYPLPSDRRAMLVYGVDPTLYYSFAVRAYRIVDPDVAASRKIVSAWNVPTASGESPYRPASGAAFAGNITGTVDGSAASAVASGAIAANNGVNPDGTIKDDKVDTPAIIVGAVSQNPFYYEPALIVCTTSGVVIADRTLTSRGKPIWLAISYTVASLNLPTGTTAYKVEVLRNGSVIWSTTVNLIVGVSARFDSFGLVDTPAAGTTAYEVLITTFAGPSVQVTNRNLIPLELTV